ncbi:hypothetical protein IGJ28_001998 [Enterococcus sp. AZ091]|uniref:hypothetical protein n=1 Tax=Enterococcus sp. AZ091 TaxID=2774720 RepID=UPI003F23FD21
MKKIINGFSIGVVCAGINMLFLLFAPDLSIDIYLSTGITWIAIGVLISSSDFKVNSVLKGMIISFLVSANSLIYTMSSSISGVLWMVVNTALIGGIAGYTIEKVNFKRKHE